jgi:hypothetical protein
MNFDQSAQNKPYTLADAHASSSASRIESMVLGTTQNLALLCWAEQKIIDLGHPSLTSRN